MMVSEEERVRQAKTNIKEGGSEETYINDFVMSSLKRKCTHDMNLLTINSGVPHYTLLSGRINL